MKLTGILESLKIFFKLITEKKLAFRIWQLSTSDMFSQKDYALHSVSFWTIYRNDSQIRLWKNLYVFGQIEKSILANKKFFFWTIFH